MDPGKADLPSVRMSAQQQIKPGIGRVWDSRIENAPSGTCDPAFSMLSTLN